MNSLFKALGIRVHSRRRKSTAPVSGRLLGVRQHTWQVLIRAHPVDISGCWMAVCRFWLPHKLHEGPLSSFRTFQERAPPDLQAAEIAVLARLGRPSKATEELSDAMMESLVGLYAKRQTTSG